LRRREDGSTAFLRCLQKTSCSLFLSDLHSPQPLRWISRCSTAELLQCQHSAASNSVFTGRRSGHVEGRGLGACSLLGSSSQSQRLNPKYITCPDTDCHRTTDVALQPDSRMACGMRRWHFACKNV
jgi:hypothetical protein